MIHFIQKVNYLFFMKKLTLFICLLCPVLLQAQGFQVNLHGQKQIAMGGSGTGLKMDAASVLFNPGAVSMLEKNSVYAGVSPLLLYSRYAGLNTSEAIDNQFKVATPFTFYAVFGPKEAKWKAGLGVYTPFGGQINWGDNWGSKNVIQSLDLKAIFIQPTFSYKISDKLGIGAGFVYALGTVDLKRGIDITGATTGNAQAELKGKSTGYGFNVGVYYQPNEKISLGLTYRSKVNAELKNGDATFSAPASLSGRFPAGNTFNSTLPLVSTTSFGIGLYPTEKLTLAFDFNYVGWSAYKELAFDFEKDATNTPGAGVTDSRSPRNYEDSYNLRGGAQYKVKDNFALRLGIAYGKTPIKDGYVSPEVPDADRVEFSGGLGYRFGEHFNVDVSYMFVNIAQRTQSVSLSEPAVTGTFKTYVHIPGIALSYLF
jgi:long-chain fatty acid transport protein